MLPLTYFYMLFMNKSPANILKWMLTGLLLMDKCLGVNLHKRDRLYISVYCTPNSACCLFTSSRVR